MNYRDSLNLPSTDFPMRAGLPKREPLIFEEWKKEGIYKLIRDAKKGKEVFILHDGPPYANGNIHMGHALNKVLKDIIIKSKTMQGYDSPYIPGWDCHGLPIEHEVVKRLGKDAKNKSQDEIRKLCREYAASFVDLQSEDFKRLGVFADYDNPYLTMSHEYEAGIVHTFKELFKRGYIYKGLKPIHWCGNCHTALAEAEIEYNDNHLSPSIYVKFPIKGVKNEYVLIWTTTPWTLPANVAVAINPELEYVKVSNGSEKYIIAKELKNSVAEDTGAELKIEENASLDYLRGLKLSHPFIKEREVVIVEGDHVTLEAGTGCVHTAPGHGQEDYAVSLKYSLPVLSPVNMDGVFTEEAGEFAGLHVFKANDAVIEKLKSENNLLYAGKVTHSYPICWRCKKDVIFRATPQWFMNLTGGDIKEKALSAAKDVKWVPSWGELRMTNMLKTRPDWCLSRQRAWGVPIPAFTCNECGKTYMTEESVDLFEQIVRQEGVDIWFTKDVKDLMPKGAKCEKCGSTDFSKENDILDVWFDSGVSSLCVLNQRNVSDIANIYLEGSDQYRGWFQSSLWPSLAIKDKAPYKEVITHGFMLDEKGKAMSKSQGNTIAPSKIVEKYGADILRLWVVSENYQDNIKVGDNLLQQVAEAYKKIRFTMRFLLSNLYDYDNAKNRVDYKEYDELAKYVTSRLSSVTKEAIDNYNTYSFHNVFHKLHLFCVVDLSNNYLDIIKDIMYSDQKDSLKRRMHQSVLYNILSALTKLLAPILTFTCEEVYKTFFNEKRSVHLEDFPEHTDYAFDEALEKKFKKVFELKEDVYRALEDAKNKGIVSNNLECKACVVFKGEADDALTQIEDSLKDYFVISGFKFADKADDTYYEGEKYFIKIDGAEGKKCERCWIYYDSVGTYADHPGLCTRCYEAVTKK